MKSIKFSKKLRLHKETVADLNNGQLKAVHGGKEVDLPLRISNPITACISYSECLTDCPSTGDSYEWPCCRIC